MSSWMRNSARCAPDAETSPVVRARTAEQVGRVGAGRTARRRARRGRGSVMLIRRSRSRFFGRDVRPGPRRRGSRRPGRSSPEKAARNRVGSGDAPAAAWRRAGSRRPIPSVRECRTAICRVGEVAGRTRRRGRPSPRSRSRAAAVRTSHSRSSSRSRAIGSAGSNRLDEDEPERGRAVAQQELQAVQGLLLCRWWASSRTRHMGAGSAASASIRSVKKSAPTVVRGRPAGRSGSTPPRRGRPTARRAPTPTAVRGSSSSSSRSTHAQASALPARPIGQQHGLAVTGRCADQREGLVRAAVQRRQQRGTGDERRGRRGYRRLRLGQRSLFSPLLGGMWAFGGTGGRGGPGLVLLSAARRCPGSWRACSFPLVLHRAQGHSGHPRTVESLQRAHLIRRG